MPQPGSGAAIDGVVVNAYWSDLQPQAGGSIAPDNVIDRTLAQVRSANAKNPQHQLFVKLRVFSGIHAPDWAKTIGGPPIQVVDRTTGATGTVGRFWLPQFGSAYSDFQHKLAARYDTVPEIREVTISRCTTVFDEPFIRDAQEPETVQALLAAGFTVSADLQCLREQIDAHAVWKLTRSGLALNPYRRIDGTKPALDESLTEAVIGYCRQQLAARCVLENNSLRYPPLGGAYAQMYSAIQAAGPPISFQTAAASKVGNLAQVISVAAGYGASAVELPAGYGGASQSELQAWSAQLRARAPSS